ncbi:hypothetical protein Pcinc_030602 [Petrolisthes cinctipes]|uniref:Uncharacterized protein n=1 Tax=Petrolisthes cinctipes TaxID=88211 RepID=A0AAE1EXS0_PETCI|nr:hypothetical protein Pcinc_030602 [Petrolisthes cinctipes]
MLPALLTFIILSVEETVRACRESDVATTLLYHSSSSSLDLLIRVLRWSHFVHPSRTVITLCSPDNLLSIFRQVKNKSLESWRTVWLVITFHDVIHSITPLLREGTQVVVVVMGGRRSQTPHTTYRLFTSRVTPEGNISFQPLEIMTQDGGIMTSQQDGGNMTSQQQHGDGNLAPKLSRQKTTTKNLTTPQQQQQLLQSYRDMEGRQLLVTTNQNWPFFRIAEWDNNDTVIGVSGIDLSVIRALAHTLNFTFRLVRPPDGKWGSPQPDGTITGLIGQVARHEAQLALCELTITSSRESVVDFTVPYYMESTTLVSPAPKEKNRAFAVFSPFTLKVWICLCAVTCGMGPLLRLLTRFLVTLLHYPDLHHYNTSVLCFNVFRNLMIQSSVFRPEVWVLRFPFFFWYLFCFYIYALYSGTLTAVLAVPTYETPIESLSDLEAAHSRGFTIATTRDSSFEHAFKSARSGIYREVWQLFDHKDRSISFLPAPEDGFDLVLKKKYVFINAQINSLVKATQRGLRRFHITRQTFLPQNYGVACPSGSPYQPVFSNVLRRMTEGGLILKWAGEEVNKAAPHTEDASHTDTTGRLTALNLQHLQAAFFLLVFGVTLAGLAMCAEMLTKRSRGRRRNTSRTRRMVVVQAYR